MDRTRVLLLFGGESSEHDVSVSSARNVYAALDDDKYDVQLCHIDKHGKWWLVDDVSNEVDFNESEQVVPVLGEHGFTSLDGGNSLRPDVIFPVLHGKNGEDGSVQGLAQLLHIPIVGCGVAASAIGMDKVASKRLASEIGLTIVPYRTHRQGDPAPNYDELSEELSSVLFVKPVRAGSSVGVNKVTSSEEFAVALSEAHRHDDVVLIEKAINAREIETSVLGTPPYHQVSGVGEIVPGEDFYSYDDKYGAASSAAVQVPADVSSEVAAKIQKQALEFFDAIGGSGLARVDFLVDGDEVYFNEINTMPGFTNISMYPKLWREQGVNYSDLVDRLLEDTV